MFKIFAKIVTGDKTLKTYDYIKQGRFDKDQLLNYLSEICQNLDIATPVILKSHVNHLVKFNNTKFKNTDFIEDVSFSRLILEKYEE